MRCFIAIDFSKEVKAKIAELQNKLRPLSARGRFKYIDNLHLTLKFLDEVDSETIVKINSELEEICRGESSFKLYISKLGHFPGRDSIRVLWLGLHGDLESLSALQSKVDNSMLSLGFEREKRAYTPHVTIGQDLIFPDNFDKISKQTKLPDFGEIVVDRVYLVKSEQIGAKRVYTPIGEHVFKND